MIARRQLLALGYTSDAILWRLRKGRLHPTRHRGVYAVGRPELTIEGHFMAAVLAAGPKAYLSHSSAALLWKILKLPRNWKGPAPPTPIHVSLLADVVRRKPGIKIHRRRALPPEDLTTHLGIPTTTPTRTLIDLATILTPKQLAATVTEADVEELVDPESLRAELDHRKGQQGVPALRKTLDRHTYRLTETELERRFLRIVRKAGLPLPETQVQLGGRVDFHWPDLNLVVETDGWRYHRTPARQAQDNRRMQAHLLAGRTAIRISHYEVRYECDRVEAMVLNIARRLEAPTASA